MTRLFHCATLTLLLSLTTPLVLAAAIADGAPYTLANTAVHTVRAPELKRDYQVFISLPKGYSATGPALPVVFVTDADYAFPLMRAIAARVGGHGNSIAPFVLVGLSYAVDDTPEFSRRRDYTPTTTDSSDMESDMPGRTPVFGEAEGYRRFLASQVLPLVEKRYRVDMKRSVFVGHSYGSLFGSHILLTSPEMFSKYVLSSPSLWFNKAVMFAREKEYAASHRDLKANVFFAVGGFEAVKRGNKLYSQERDMVRDLRNFDAVLSSRRYPGLRTQVYVFEGHDHLTVYPDMITKALKWATTAR